MMTPFHIKREVAGLWVGEELPLLAELCIRSYLFHGVSFRLFTYKKYRNIPPGTIIDDASRILPEELIYFHTNGSLAPFADWFRNAWLSQAGGFWTDLDVACLTSDFPEEVPWFAFQNPGLVAVGVIGFPPHHPVIETLLTVSEDPATPMPWDSQQTIENKCRFKRKVPDVVLRRKTAPWGTTAGPEGFTQALKHFDLLDKAYPSSTIYPFHYTVWRECFQKSLPLNCHALSKSWAIHLWGELLRREPDALDNVRRDSIVGRLMDRHIPLDNRYYSRGNESKKKVSILVGICSCLNSSARRLAVRETWLKNQVPGIECRFFLGRRTPIPDEDDVVTLWVPDCYESLPEKGLAFYQYALEHYDFDWLFKCDDDTYLDLSRLPSLCKAEYDLVGDISLQDRGAPSGGAGYLMSRSLVEKIVSFQDIPLTGAEDLIFGEIAKKVGARVHATTRLVLSTTPFPKRNNDQISAHWCPPDFLRLIHTFYHSDPLTVYEGKHTFWTDHLVFYPGGFFFREKSGCTGRYVIHNDKALTLQWNSWPSESLILQNGEYVGASLILSQAEGSVSLQEICDHGDPLPNEPIRMQLGGDHSIRKGWLHFSLSSGLLTGNFPWQDNLADDGIVDEKLEFLSISEVWNILKEMARVLKPGGLLRLKFTDWKRYTRPLSFDQNSTHLSIQLNSDKDSSSITSFLSGNVVSAWDLSLLQTLLKEAGYELPESGGSGIWASFEQDIPTEPNVVWVIIRKSDNCTARK